MTRILAAALFACTLWAQTYQERALQISRDIQERHIPFGTILNPVYASPESTVIVNYSRCGDSALWTGHWLAAESFRYRVAPSAEALEAARRALGGIQALVGVTGEGNLLARCLLRADSPFSTGPRSEERQHGEYRGVVDGVDYYWIGNTSRDQYIGVFFGLSVAYELIDDPAMRATIRDLVTRLTGRLLETGWRVVMPSGQVSTVFWLRPDQQLAILQVARQVHPERFAAIYADRRRSAAGLETIMSVEAQNEHDSYFKFNLAATTWYTLIRLEEPGSPKLDSYLEAYRRFRSAVQGHGNLFFNVIDRALQGPNTRRDVESMELLASWTLRPRRDFRVDLRGVYRACGEDRACEPIPVPERVRTDFLWQRSPFLLYGGGEGTIESPGLDFILPYWMGRFYGASFHLMAVSAASGAPVLAPESIASLHGSGFAPGSVVEVADSAGRVRAPQIFFLGERQVNFLIPAATATGAARISLIAPGGTRTHSTVVNISTVAPALFSANATGRGAPAAVAIRVEAGGAQIPVEVFRCAGPLLCTLQPVELNDRPVYLSLYGTGLRWARGPIVVKVDEEEVPVTYAGPQGQFAGLDQVNVRLDRTVRTRGERNLTVFAAGVASNVLRILLR